MADYELAVGQKSYVLEIDNFLDDSDALLLAFVRVQHYYMYRPGITTALLYAALKNHSRPWIYCSPTQRCSKRAETIVAKMRQRGVGFVDATVTFLPSSETTASHPLGALSGCADGSLPCIVFDDECDTSTVSDDRFMEEVERTGAKIVIVALADGLHLREELECAAAACRYINNVRACLCQNKVIGYGLTHDELKSMFSFESYFPQRNPNGSERLSACFDASISGITRSWYFEKVRPSRFRQTKRTDIERTILGPILAPYDVKFPELFR